MDKRFISVKELADMIGLAPKTVYHRISRSAENPLPFKAHRFGRTVRFDMNEIERFLED